MIGYFLAGAARNLLGLVLLAWFVGKGLGVTASLSIVVVIGFCLFSLQARYFVGHVDTKKVFLTFVCIFIGNRFMLWLLYEELGLHITVAQLISMLVFSFSSYLFLRRNRHSSD